MLGQAKPRDRSEREIFGYRHALSLIHTDAESLAIDPLVLQRLHRTIQEDSGDAGHWKKIENEIIELKAGEAARVRFRPVAAAVTPAAVDELCLLYRDAVNQRRAPPLVTVAALVLEFLCIHPFRDGNGRVSRLVTILALYPHGYDVGRYISLERLVEETREESGERIGSSRAGPGMFEALAARSVPWYWPLSILSPARLRWPIFERACPAVSRDMIRRVLTELRQQRAVECKRGRHHIRLVGETPDISRAPLGHVALDERARVQIDDHSRFSLTMSAMVRPPRARASGFAAGSRRPLQRIPPARRSASTRSSRESDSGMMRATRRPCSVTTMVAPFLTSRTHSLSFDLSSRMPIRRSV